MPDFLHDLLDGKSILTLVVALVFAVLSVKGMIAADKTYNIIEMVVIFYFARNGNGNGKGETK